MGRAADRETTPILGLLSQPLSTKIKVAEGLVLCELVIVLVRDVQIVCWKSPVEAHIKDNDNVKSGGLSMLGSGLWGSGEGLGSWMRVWEGRGWALVEGGRSHLDGIHR